MPPSDRPPSRPAGSAGVQWLLEHSEVTAASPRFAWTYMTDVSNWADPPAQFELLGPFEDGAPGKTILPGQEPVHWRVRDVRTGISYVIESDLDGAALVCEWSFSERGGGTRLTQRLGVAGDGAEGQADGVRAAFGPTLAAGMQRIAKLLDAADRAREGAPDGQADDQNVE